MSENKEQANKTIEEGLSAQVNNEREGKSTIYTCPQCGGVLWQQEKDRNVEFLCHVGHHCSAETLLTEKAQDAEQALWTALRTQVEQATLLRHMAKSTRENRTPHASAQFEELMAARLEAQAEAIEKDMEQLREMIEALPRETEP
jgi:two-component system, chemotaxis family, protein-glutamate methylesterase/glutaminase